MVTRRVRLLGQREINWIFLEGRPSQRQEETRSGIILKEGDSCIISIGQFFHVHAILLCFLGIMRFYFGV